jgi:hypothetical protein
MLYQNFNVNKITTKRREQNIWDTQKSTEVDARWAQKKEELRKEIKKNNIYYCGEY